MVQVTLTSTTNLHSLAEFRNLVVKQTGGANIRLSDVAEVSLGAESYETRVTFDGKVGVFIAIQVAPSANLLTAIKGVRDAFPQILAELPQGLQGEIIYDSTDFVNASIREVAVTLIEAMLIVMAVIFAFLGSPRSVLIPVIAIPLSLIGTLGIMLALHFSINLLTLLALVLAIGLVVDDAIIVVENVNRHLEGGMAAIEAAGLAARELAAPIVAMTVVLLAVFTPIGFQGGLTGALFVEFAFTLAGAVTVSAVIALTLSPMMCSKLLVPHRPDARDWESRLVHVIDGNFSVVRNWYQRRLQASLRYTPVTAVLVVVIIASIYLLYSSSKSELAPQEDQGFLLVSPSYAPDATLQQRSLFDDEAIEIAAKSTNPEHEFLIDGAGQTFIGLEFPPRNQRKLGTDELSQILQQKISGVAGLRGAVFQPPSLPGAFGLPMQFVIKTTDPAARLNEVSRNLLDEAVKSGNFLFLDTDMKFDLPQSVIEIDREKTAQLGLTLNQVGTALGGLLGGGYVNYFSMDTRAYKVIPQVQRSSRLNFDQLLTYPIATLGGVSVPLSTVARIHSVTVPESLNHFQQLNSATISGVMRPGISLEDALKYLQALAAKTMPQGYSMDYAGQARQFVAESSGIMVTFALAIIIVFLALAALFESFRDPFVILISVPLSIAGALVFIAIGVGGAIHQHLYRGRPGHAHGPDQQARHPHRRGRQRPAGTRQIQVRGYRGWPPASACGPILMTTAAMVLGVLPLVFASGAGAASRFAIGLVISTGLAIGTLFTLFVVPGVYMLVGADHARRNAAPGTANPAAPPAAHMAPLDA